MLHVTHRAFSTCPPRPKSTNERPTESVVPVGVKLSLSAFHSKRNQRNFTVSNGVSETSPFPWKLDRDYTGISESYLRYYTKTIEADLDEILEGFRLEGRH